MTDRGEPSAGVGILVFDGVEVLDFAGPFEVFSVTRRSGESRLDGQSPMPPRLLSSGRREITATGGLRVTADASLEDAAGLDALVIPGGYGVRALMADEAFLARLLQLSRDVELVMSVCTGAGVLARAGLLRQRRVTTHHAYLEWLAELAPDCEVVGDCRVVDEGDLVTAGGISAGIDAALHLVERWQGRAVADETAAYMEYRRQPVGPGAA
ncbi:DJ-1/PfpI family protein [Gammaproteobacteria bacterium AB-CW1]|uniref:DJ-1/PfpI family protein n=1 Tax=Natronospira elongata TaxID=3110268 RepID=A0AAP6JDV0_9GAMM|nr:DJ-1/PfpI family protein [Gammaproteobacteria bacterium AB-CW1]